MTLEQIKGLCVGYNNLFLLFQLFCTIPKYKFEQYLFKATHTYTSSLFEKNFILPKEREEGIAVEN